MELLLERKKEENKDDNSQLEEFVPNDYFNQQKIEIVDDVIILECPELHSLYYNLKHNCARIIDGIYQTEKVAFIKQIPISDITSEIEVFRNLVGTVIPVEEVDYEANSMTMYSKFAIASLGIKILSLMVNWEENIEEIIQTYKFFKKLKSFEEQNNPDGNLLWNFKSDEGEWKIDDFAEIMQVRV